MRAGAILILSHPIPSITRGTRHLGTSNIFGWQAMILLNDLLDETTDVPPPYESAVRRRGIPPPGYTANSTGQSQALGGHEGAQSQDSQAYDEATQSLRRLAWFQVCSYLLLDSTESQAESRSALHRDVRFVERSAYRAVMSLLRPHYLAAYQRMVKHPFTTSITTDTVSSPKQQQSAPASPHGTTRELKVLDLYIAAEVKREADLFGSDLLQQPGLDGLFELHQPRARLEDLLVERGLQAGQLFRRSLLSHTSDPVAHTPRSAAGRVLAEDLTLLFTLKRVDVRLPFRSAASIPTAKTREAVSEKPLLVRKAIFSAERTRSTPLEETAEDILDYLAQGCAASLQLVWMSAAQTTRSDGDGASRAAELWTWYEQRAELVEVTGGASNNLRDGERTLSGDGRDSRPRNRFSRWLRSS
ncbi:unnamed protein product [Parajaminaea phylloscopi]